jgi:hypothetical protein
MTRLPVRRWSRAVVAFDYRGHASLAVEITHCVTTATRSEFLGALIEDVDLLAHSRSSLAREVLYSGTSRPLETAALSRQLRARSREAQTEFERTADKLGLPHAFRSFHDRALAEIAKWADESGSPVVTLAAESIIERLAQQSEIEELLTASVQALLFAREGWRAGSAILALIDDVGTADAALSIAAQLAEASGSPLYVDLEGAAATDTAATQLIAQLAETIAVPVHVAAREDGTDADAIAASARNTRARIVVLPWHLATTQPGLIRQLFRATNAAIALVR